MLPLASRVASKTDQRRKRPVFLDINVSYRASDIRQEKSIGPAQEGECCGLWLAPVGTCGVAMAFQYDRIFYHSYRYSLLLLAALTAIQRPLILALIDECSQGRWGAHGHRSIADLYEPARRHPLQHHADGIA